MCRWGGLASRASRWRTGRWPALGAPSERLQVACPPWTTALPPTTPSPWTSRRSALAGGGRDRAMEAEVAGQQRGLLPAGDPPPRQASWWLAAGRLGYTATVVPAPHRPLCRPSWLGFCAAHQPRAQAQQVPGSTAPGCLSEAAPTRCCCCAGLMHVIVRKKHTGLSAPNAAPDKTSHVSATSASCSVTAAQQVQMRVKRLTRARAQRLYVSVAPGRRHCQLGASMMVWSGLCRFACRATFAIAARPLRAHSVLR